MTDKKPLTVPQRTMVLLLILAIAVSGFVLGSFVMAPGGSPQKRSKRSSAAPLVGTWKGEIGNVLNFRRDGTARATKFRRSDRLL